LYNFKGFTEKATNGTNLREISALLFATFVFVLQRCICIRQKYEEAQV
jgi:hypothetical protein